VKYVKIKLLKATAETFTQSVQGSAGLRFALNFKRLKAEKG